MAKARAKKARFGHSLQVNDSGAKGADNWRRVGFNFPTRAAAFAYVQQKHSHTKKYLIKGIRLNVEPLKAPTGRTELES